MAWPVWLLSCARCFVVVAALVLASAPISACAPPTTTEISPSPTTWILITATPNSEAPPMYDDEEEYDEDEFRGPLPGYRVEPGSAAVIPSVSRPGTLGRNAVVLELRQSADEGPDYWYGQLFQWTAPADQGAVPCALELKIQQQGTALNIPANGTYGWWTITYGSGTTLRTVQVDPTEATIQLPPCDFVSVELTIFAQVFILEDPITAYASLGRGYYPDARPPTFTYGAYPTLAGAALPVLPFIDKPVPAQAKAVSVLLGAPTSVFPAAPTVPVAVARLELKEFGSTSAAVQVVSTSTDGSADYPGYSPAPIQADNLPGTGDATWSLWAYGDAGDQTSVLVIFYLAL